MSYICTECGHVFEEPHVYEERHGLDHGPYEKWSVCPACGEPGYDEVAYCDRCEAAYPRQEGQVLCRQTLCPSCYAELEELQDTESWERAPVSSSFQLVILTTGERELTLAALRHCACVYEANPEGILVATHDPSEKTTAEKRFESFVLESVLSTQVIPGQWRSMVARALLWFASRYVPDDAATQKVYKRVAQRIWPWSLLPWPTAQAIAGPLNPSDAETLDTQKLLTQRRIRSINDELTIRGFEDPNTHVVIQIGQDIYSLPAHLVRVNYSGEM